MNTNVALVIALLAIVLQNAIVSNGQLSMDFYDTSCPNLTSIVSSTFQSLAKRNNVVSPSTLRLLIHDCFIQVTKKLQIANCISLKRFVSPDRRLSYYYLNHQNLIYLVNSLENEEMNINAYPWLISFTF